MQKQQNKITINVNGKIKRILKIKEAKELYAIPPRGNE